MIILPISLIHLVLANCRGWVCLLVLCKRHEFAHFHWILKWSLGGSYVTLVFFLLLTFGWRRCFGWEYWWASGRWGHCSPSHLSIWLPALRAGQLPHAVLFLHLLWASYCCWYCYYKPCIAIIWFFLHVASVGKGSFIRGYRWCWGDTFTWCLRGGWALIVSSHH